MPQSWCLDVFLYLGLGFLLLFPLFFVESAHTKLIILDFFGVFGALEFCFQLFDLLSNHLFLSIELV
jgi:hypothetical protein